MLLSRILVLLLPNTEVLVRFELLYLSGGVSGGKLSQALIHPLKNPSQSAVINLFDGINDTSSIIHNLIMENLLRVDSFGFK